MNLLTIKAVEVDAFLTDRDRADELVDGRVLRMGHGHAAADAGATELFAFEYRGDDALVIVWTNSTGLDGAVPMARITVSLSSASKCVRIASLHTKSENFIVYRPMPCIVTFRCYFRGRNIPA